MSETTNIADLPSAHGNEPTATSSANTTTAIDQDVMRDIISGIQRAALSGATKLSSRDIPFMGDEHARDPQVQPNYVPPLPPPAERVDYIRNYEQTEDMVDKYNKQVNTQNAMEDIYSEMQIPILVMMLYFLFQLHFFKKSLLQYLPVLFFNDGNMNLYGFFFTSFLFGMFYYVIQRITKL